jgi:hypothetical protein
MSPAFDVRNQLRCLLVITDERRQQVYAVLTRGLTENRREGSIQLSNNQER